MSRNPIRDQVRVDCECSACGVHYVRFRTPSIRFVRFAPCAACAACGFAAWVRERATQAGRVLH